MSPTGAEPPERGDVPDFTASTASRPHRILLPLSVDSGRVAADVPRATPARMLSA
jgi:hypothetical protein